MLKSGHRAPARWVLSAVTQDHASTVALHRLSTVTISVRVAAEIAPALHPRGMHRTDAGAYAPQFRNSGNCKCTCYAFRVPNKPKTPNRVIRVDDDLWRDYGAACETDGVTRSDDLRAYMLRKVKAWKRRQTAEIEEYSGA
jgi:hypothetical protein